MPLTATQYDALRTDYAEQAVVHLHAAIGALKDAREAAQKAGQGNTRYLDRALELAENAWSTVDPFHAIENDEAES